MRRGLILFGLLALIFIVSLFLTLPARAHSEHELEEYTEDWTERVREEGFTWELVTEYLDMMDRHQWYSEWTPPAPVPTSSSTSTGTSTGTHHGMGSNVEQWRGLVAAYFPGEVETALCIMAAESGGNPNALNPSGASGLFQVMPFWFDKYGGERFDPENNVRVAAKVRAEQGWSAWSPWKRGACR